MDFHELKEFSENTLEELHQGHKLDLAVQAKYNVSYKHYYVCSENRKIFCVMEGPDKESCEAVHREAHGLIACNLVQVELNQYGLIMGFQKCDPAGMNIHEDGSRDSGLRTIIYIRTTILHTGAAAKSEISQASQAYVGKLRDILSRHGGRELASGRSEIIYAFTNSADAARCGHVLQHQMLSHKERPGKIFR